MSNTHAWFDLIVACTPGEKASLVEALLDVKARTGSVTEEDVRNESDRLGLSVADARGVASFFNGFEFHTRQEASRKKPPKAFDPWEDPPCKLWNKGR